MKENYINIRDSALRLIDNMISNIELKCKDASLTRLRTPAELDTMSYFKEVVGEHNVASLCMLGLEPRSFDTLVNSLYRTRQYKTEFKQAKYFFDIVTSEPLKNRSNIYCVKR